MNIHGRFHILEKVICMVKKFILNRYLGGAFDVESLVENLLGQLAGNQAIVVKVYDITNSSDPLIMYGREYQDGDISLKRVSMLDFGDPFRKHQMICR